MLTPFLFLILSVIMATGLIALVDDCIRDRWQAKKAHRLPVPLIPKAIINPKTIMQHVFGRRNSSGRCHPSAPSSPLRFANHAAAY